MTLIRCPAIGIALLVVSFGSAFSADIISDWNMAKTPPPPELKEVTIDPATTALLLLDIMKENCGVRPRCPDTVPKIKALMGRARAAGALVAYTLPGGGEIIDPGIAKDES